MDVRELTRQEKCEGIAENLALHILNEPEIAGRMTQACVTAILNDCGYHPSQAVEEFAADPHDFVWLSCAALSVRDTLYQSWGFALPLARSVDVVQDVHRAFSANGTPDVSMYGYAMQSLAALCPYDDTILWQRIAYDVMPSAEVVQEFYNRSDKPRSSVAPDRHRAYSDDGERDFDEEDFNRRLMREEE